jgi:hypothetical protein
MEVGKTGLAEIKPALPLFDDPVAEAEGLPMTDIAKQP